MKTEKLSLKTHLINLMALTFIAAVFLAVFIGFMTPDEYIYIFGTENVFELLK